MAQVDKEKRYSDGRGIALYWTGKYEQHFSYDEFTDTTEEEGEDDLDWPIMIMVGDDTEFSVDISTLTEIDEDAYCGQCGSTSCAHE